MAGGQTQRYRQPFGCQNRWVKGSHHASQYRPAKGEFDADSMNYSINRVSGYYGLSKVISRQ